MSRSPLRSVTLGAGMLLFLLAVAHSVAAQSGDWSTPELIYETVESIDAPYLASDAAGVTHLVWRETQRDTGEPSTALEAIFYTNDLDGRLSQGRDVIAMNGVVGPVLAGDADGLVHLVFRGTNDTLYHSLAATDGARSAQGWVEPAAIAASNLNAQIKVDADRVAHIVFPGTQATGIYYIRYDADSDAWSSPVLVSLTATDEASADYTQLAIGPDGSLHVVWTEFLLPGGWPPTGIYYAQSTDGGATWSRAVELAGENNVQGNVAVDSQGNVHAVWNGVVGIGGRYHSWSDDGGKTWTLPVAAVAAGQGGMSGTPQLAFDSDDTLHFLSAYGVCAYYLTWENGEWSDAECISEGAGVPNGLIEQPTLTVTNGNEVHAVFWVERATLWHTMRTADAPFVSPAVPAETAVVADAAVPAVTPAESPSPEAVPTFDLSAAPPPAAQPGPGRALLPAVGAVTGLLALALLIKMARAR